MQPSQIRQVGWSAREDSPLHKCACAVDSSVCHEEGVHDLQLRRTASYALRRHPDGSTLHQHTPLQLCKPTWLITVIIQVRHILLSLLPYGDIPMTAPCINTTPFSCVIRHI